MVKDLEMSVVSENSPSFLYVIVFTYYCLMGEEKRAGKYLFYSHKIFHMRPASCSLVMICQILLFYHNDSTIVSIFFLLTLSNSVFFIESHVLLFFFFSPPFIFLLIAVTMPQPRTQQTGHAATSWDMDNFGESAKWVQLIFSWEKEEKRYLLEVDFDEG